MPFVLYTRSLGHGNSLASVTTSPAAQACVAALLAPDSGRSVPDAWQVIYRRAYEQARAAVQPSRFQLMLQPSWN
jgi:hypothetical protein